MKVYGVAGVAADYNIKSQQEMEGLTQEISRDRWQFSLKGGLGVEYDVIPQLGIYVEPGLKYYFDNGSRVQNFFNELQPTARTPMESAIMDAFIRFQRVIEVQCHGLS